MAIYVVTTPFDTPFDEMVLWFRFFSFRGYELGNRLFPSHFGSRLASALARREFFRDFAASRS